MYEYKIQIKRVVDGDTLEVVIDLGFNVKMTDTVRLIGIDTPEVFGPNASDAGRNAKAFTEQWVSDRSVMSGYFIFESKRYNQHEKYGRILGSIKFKNELGITHDLTNDLIKAGLVK